VRLDSGDLDVLSRKVRAILDDAGLSDIRILASGDLDEYRIADLIAAGAPIDAFGVGTRMGTSADAPSLGVVYKLVEDEHGPKLKLAEGKATLPGRKQVWRQDGVDVLGLIDENLEGRALLGAAKSEPVNIIRDRCRDSIARLPDRLRRLEPAHPRYDVRTSTALETLVGRLLTDRGR
jgi:nicotinate phosphoribosyltransferase